VKNDWWEVSFRTAPQLVLAEALYERGALAEDGGSPRVAHELAAASVRTSTRTWRPNG
jgi:hypothetical protein